MRKCYSKLTLEPTIRQSLNKQVITRRREKSIILVDDERLIVNIENNFFRNLSKKTFVYYYH